MSNEQDEKPTGIPVPNIHLSPPPAPKIDITPNADRFNIGTSQAYEPPPAPNIQEFPIVTSQTGSSVPTSGIHEAPDRIPAQYLDYLSGSAAAPSSPSSLARLVTPAANGAMTAGGYTLPGITSASGCFGTGQSSLPTIMGANGNVLSRGAPVSDPVKGTTFNAKRTFLAAAIVLVEQLLFDLAMKPSQQAQAGAQLDTFGQQIQQLIAQIQNTVNQIPQQALQSPAGQQFLQNMQQLLAGLNAIAAAHWQAGQVMQTSAQQTASIQTATAIKTTAMDLVVGMLMSSLFGFWAAIGVAAGMVAFMKLMSQTTDSSLNQMSGTVDGIQTQTTDSTLAAMQTALGQLQQGASQLQAIASGATTTNGTASTNPFLQSPTGAYDPSQGYNASAAMNPTVGTGWQDINPSTGSGSASTGSAGTGSAGTGTPGTSAPSDNVTVLKFDTNGDLVEADLADGVTSAHGAVDGKKFDIDLGSKDTSSTTA